MRPPRSLRARLLVYGALVTGLVTPAVALLQAARFGVPTVAGFLWHFGALLLLELLLLLPLWAFLHRQILAPLNVLVQSDRDALAQGSRPRPIPEDHIPSHELGEVMRSRNQVLTHLAKLESRFRRRVRELVAAMSEVSAAREASDLAPAVERVLHGVREVVGADAAAALVFDPDTGTVMAHARLGFPESNGELLREMERCGRARLASCGPGLTFVPASAGCAVGQPEGFACVPLAGARRTLGVLGVQRWKRSFSDQELDVLETVARHLGVVLENFYLYQQSLRLAIQDGLTELYTRRYAFERLREEMERARRTGQPFSVLMLDLNGFKAINDRYGHLVGDRALQAVAAVLKAELRTSDVLSRYGGDEFFALLPGAGKAEATAVGSRIREAVARVPFRPAPEGPDLALSVAVGVAAFPGDGQTADELVACADRAMYEAKGGLARNGREPGAPVPSRVP